jgi:mono/diheme cytochrome c family protein
MIANMKKFIFSALVIGSVAVLSSCGHDSQSTGTEYAPQMYNAVGYEPFNQVTDTANEYYNSNPYNVSTTGSRAKVASNMRPPVTGTVNRKMYAGTPRTEIAKQIFVYNIPADSVDLAGRTLRNPIPLTPEVLEEGKTLYLRFCSPCHGAEGKGNGKVADMYKGVPAYNATATKNLPAGHIFHVITYGIRRMWPHGTQVNPDERWKIVHYVQTLQKQS